MARVTNAQLMAAIESLDKRILAVEGILMTSKLNRNGNSSTPVNPTVALIIRFIVFPLVVIVGTLVGAERFLLGG
ncbi:unnamed protein product [marine sediment metagenome]|uniref:Uncharacterized protein n=1 Tax=marine sediment metagenome TaxID=412755 RepID=X1PZB2_9ZZZZ